MDAFLDENVSDNFSLLPDLLRSLEREKELLQRHLVGTEVCGASEGKDGWEGVLGSVQAALGELKALEVKCDDVSCPRSVKEGGGGREEDGRVGGGGAEGGKVEELLGPEVANCVEGVLPLTTEYVEAEKARKYFLWMCKIQEVSSKIESGLKTSSVTEAMSAFSVLREQADALEGSSCAHLRSFVRSVRNHWRTRLKEKLSSDFSDVLKELKWPLVSSPLPPSSASSSSRTTRGERDMDARFTKLFNLLLQFDDPATPTAPPPSCDHAPLVPPGHGRPILLPIQLLLKPLLKRFRYHFYGDKKTNSKEKPEWYFTQVSTWIGDHSDFLENRVQHILNEGEYSGVDARLQFIGGLLDELVKKVERDLDSVLYNDLLLGHLIDELLLFERELRSIVQYPPSLPSPVAVLLAEVPFHRWLVLEREYALERLASLSSSPTAWLSSYPSGSEADDTKVPECAEGFMSLLAGITERYRMTPSPSHQLKFLELQVELLLEFHRDLDTAARKVSSSSSSSSSLLVPQSCAYLNASNFIRNVLSKWGEEEFFLRLHYYTQEHPSQGEDRQPAVGSSPFSPLSPPFPPSSPLPSYPLSGYYAYYRAPSVSSSKLESIRRLRRVDLDYARSEGSVFQAAIDVFSGLADTIRDWMVGCAREGVSSCCRKNEGIFGLRRSNVMSEDHLASIFSSVTSSLSSQCDFIDSNVSPLVSGDIFNAIIKDVDQTLFKEVITNHQFGGESAKLLCSHVNKALVPLLCQFTDSPLPQILEKCQDVCQLFSLLEGSAKLLREKLARAVPVGPIGVYVWGGGGADSEAYADAVAALSDTGAHTLDPREALQVLDLRMSGGWT